MLRMEDAKAEADFNMALKLDSTEAEAVLNMALLRLRQGDGEQALPLADKALRMKTDRPALALYTRGIAKEYVGQLKAAYADLVAAHELDPNWPLPMEELKRYQLIKKD
jgi:tetratricopeptide (TPR) repeat protein